MIDPKTLLEPATRGRLLPYYAEARPQTPIMRLEGVNGNLTYWALLRYDDAIAALKHPALIKDVNRLPAHVLEKYPPQDEAYAVLGSNMLFQDPPDHTRLRALVHKGFTPRMIENLRSRIQQIADDLLDQVQVSGRGEFDLIDEYAFLLPITVIAELLGVPVEERERFRDWTQAFLGSDRDRTVVAAMEFMMYFNELFEERRADPRDDLISALVQVEEAGEQLSNEELISMVLLLLVAGHETTVNLIGNGMLALLNHPEQMRLLRENPHMIRDAVEEMLRYEGPIEFATERYAAEDLEIGGQKIAQGDVVMAGLIAANTDPAVFPDPLRFDITRDAHRHIAFGNGIHYCLGAPLARLEGAIAINTLLARLPDLEMACDPRDIAWTTGLLVHGMKSLPLRF